MRLVLCAVSAIALSGCSWLGGVSHNGSQNGYAKHSSQQNSQRYNGSARYNQGVYGQNQYAQNQSVNRGATNGFPQQPQFGEPTFTSGNYGTHAASAQKHGAYFRRDQTKLRKPKFRGSLSLGGEKSFSGDALNYNTFPTIPASGLPSDPTVNYIPNAFAEGSTTGSVASGQVVQTSYTAGPRDSGSAALYDRVSVKDKSLDDVWSTPARLAIGGEYIISEKNTIFANVGYSAAEGKPGTAASVFATLYRTTTTQDFDTDTGAPVGGPITNTSFIPDEQIADFSADFSDMKRLDLEVGGRHYFNSLNKSGGVNTVTPFVSGAIGASRYNAVTYKTDQRQRFYQQAFENPDGESSQFYNLDGQETKVSLYDSQWVPSGQLNAGVEWQVTPKTGIALETGVRIEGARKYTNDERGDTNVAIPFTIRGSYNF
jgi:hypothetical protein